MYSMISRSTTSMLGAIAFAIAATSSLAVTAQSADPGPVTLKEMKIGKAVYGTDGIKIGEINRIKAASDGKVTELHVTTGGPAGLGAEVIAITPDKVASTDTSGTALKLSMSAEDAKKLPVLTADQKG